MFQFWIIRSGITEFDRQGRVMGNLDVPLHTDADQEIEAIISQMNGHPIEMVYTFWQPWVKNFTGETSMGYVEYNSFPAYIWIDKEMRKGK